MFSWFWKFMDWFDDRILNHRFYWLCETIADHYPEVDELIDDFEPWTMGPDR